MITGTVLSGYFAIAGAGSLAFALFETARRVWLCAFGVRTVGKIVIYRRRWKAFRGERDSFMPLVRFTSADGCTVEFQARTSADPNRSPPGSPVQVAFHPQRPSWALIVSPAQLIAAPLAFAMLGIGLLMAAMRSAG